MPFEYATRVFLDPSRLDHVDTRQPYGEERRLTMGKIEDRVYIVVYTRRNSIIR